MFWYLRYGFLALLALGLVTIALANRDPVVLRLLPEDIATFAGANFVLRVPLFLAVFAGIVLGLLIGFVWEWLREAKLRAQGNRARRDAASLEREVRRLKAPANEEDDVLALLEDNRKAG